MSEKLKTFKGKKSASGRSNNSESESDSDSNSNKSIISIIESESDSDLSDASDDEQPPSKASKVNVPKSNPKLQQSITTNAQQFIAKDSSETLSKKDQTTSTSTGTGVEEPRRETGYLAAAHGWSRDLRKLFPDKSDPDKSDLTATPEDCQKFKDLLSNNDKLDSNTLKDLNPIANKLTTNDNVTEADLKKVFDNVPISILTSYPNVMILVLIKIIEQQVIEYNNLDIDASIDDIAINYQTILELTMAFEKLYDFKYKNSVNIGAYVKSKFQNNLNIRPHALKWHGVNFRKKDAHINFAGPNDKVKKDKHFGWFGSIHRHPIKFFCCFGIGCLAAPYVMAGAGSTAVTPIFTGIGNLVLGALNSLGAALSSGAGTQVSSGFIFFGLNNSTKQTPIVFENGDVQPLIDYDLNSAIEGGDKESPFDDIINRMFIKADTRVWAERYKICISILEGINGHVLAKVDNIDKHMKTDSEYMKTRPKDLKYKLDLQNSYLLPRNTFINRVRQNKQPTTIMNDSTIMNDFFKLLNNTITDIKFDSCGDCPKVIVKHLNKLKTDIETTIMMLPSPQKILFARIIHLLKNSLQSGKVTRITRLELRVKQISNWNEWFTKLKISRPKFVFNGGNTKRKISLVKKRTSTSRIRRFTKRTSITRIRRFTKRVL
jgi:hypothetical protein